MAPGAHQIVLEHIGEDAPGATATVDITVK
jgi:hypothetical protein